VKQAINIAVCGICLAGLPLCAQTNENGYAKAVSLLQEGIVFEAIHELERFTRFNPDDEDARMLLARSLHRVKRDARAAEELSHVVRLNPKNMEAARLLTRLRVEIGQRLDRHDRDAILRYARLCAVPGSYDRAAAHYQLALELEDSPSVHLEFARMLSWAERYPLSAYHYERFLAASAGNADVLMELGRVYNASSQFDKAVATFKRCLAVQPDNIAASLDLARSLIWSGREDEAKARLDRMVQKQVGGETPLILLATIANYRNETLDEYALLSRVLEMDPDNREAKARIAFLETGSRLEEAALLARVNANPGNVDARRKLAELYIAEERHGDALFQLQLIREQLPDDEATATRLREVRDLEVQRVVAQIEAFRTVRYAARTREISDLQGWLRENPDDMKSRLRLATLYLEDGDYEEASQHFQLLIDKDPSNLFIQQNLTRLQLLLAQREEAAREEQSTSNRSQP
jgi:thioredoxin-like negative regulator of GroEL